MTGRSINRIWRNAQLATMHGHGADLGLVDKGAIASDADGRIAYVGPETGLTGAADAEVIDCHGRWITPGLIDCHTHLVFGGNRAAEFEMRLAGASYEEIARRGGGIVSTVKATREATDAALLAGALARLDALLAEGVTTVEIKSGYGLDRDTELRQLRAARATAGRRSVDVTTTFLGLHALPAEYRDDRAGFVRLVCEEILPAAAAEGLCDAVDAFCESIAFTGDECAQLFTVAKSRGLALKLHADQLSNGHGAALAARFGALSADHVEHTDAAGALAMAEAGSVAVLLPGAFYFLREKQLPPVAAFRDAGVPMALATDCNPGSSPLTSPLLAMNMAATLFRMTVPECLLGMTRNAARALGMGDQVGTLAVGKWCNLAIWEIDRPAELVYRIGFNPLWRRVWRGK